MGLFGIVGPNMRMGLTLAYRGSYMVPPMAFISKVGNILKHTVSKHTTSELSASNPSIYQAIRCMSSSKLFIGGLSYSTDDTSLGEAFTSYGEVVEGICPVFPFLHLMRELSWIVRRVDPEASALLVSHQARRPQVPFRPWMVSGAGGNYGSGNHSVTGGGGDNFGSGGNGDNSFASGGYGSNQGNSMGVGADAGGCGQANPLEGSYKDNDDAPVDYASRSG
ncbi:hypothetical protein HHK36_029928 [Tetracentron sinense]|uniref:RRM domain-containing protein n=1 Tax=Tetracentron sinense TaxID=13715 RepID=A0A835D018_TETSI|nr:hypothetical protein HHK36_029928 [Tetracentron sinense]